MFIFIRIDLKVFVQFPFTIPLIYTLMYIFQCCLYLLMYEEPREFLKRNYIFT